jgi:hypothetical protein
VSGIITRAGTFEEERKIAIEHGHSGQLVSNYE